MRFLNDLGVNYLLQNVSSLIIFYIRYDLNNICRVPFVPNEMIRKQCDMTKKIYSIPQIKFSAKMG